jgi:hypothetical protein
MPTIQITALITSLTAVLAYVNAPFSKLLSQIGEHVGDRARRIAGQFVAHYHLERNHQGAWSDGWLLGVRSDHAALSHR